MKFTSSSLLPTSFLALAVGAVSGALIPRTTGPATFYNPGGNLGACGNPIQDSDFAVALNSADYANGAHCGQNINVQFNGASITVNVQDLCPGCQAGGIDLTAGAFAALADPSVGVIEVTWNFD
ncbi:RlpA-like double-psi beta-barrel-protein domain-containing protein-containing protein [Mycena leptocephala]|nr:RlpA-like double-psi beta-barrel-protein domain-containing protein-containing protein [Mycena leptocephala]